MKKLFYTLASVILITYLLIETQLIMKPLILALMLSVAINPVVEKLRDIVKNHAVSFILVLTGIAVVFALLTVIIGGQVMSLFSDLRGDQFAYDNIKETLSSALGSIGLNMDNFLNASGDSVPAIFSNISGLFGSFLTAGGDSVLMLLLTIVMAYFLSAYYPGLRKQFIIISPDDYSSKLRSSLSTAPKVIRAYIRGMGIVMVLLSLMTTIAYWIIGVDYAVVWGLITGVLAFIPYLGTSIAVVLPVTYSVVSHGNFEQAFLIVISFLIIQQVEGNFLTPKIVGKNVNMNPLAIIIIMLISGKVWGLTGVFICIPVAAIGVNMLSLFDSAKPFARLLSADLKSKS